MVMVMAKKEKEKEKRSKALYLSSYACANLALSFINKAVVRRKEIHIGVLMLSQCLATVTVVQLLIHNGGGKGDKSNKSSKDMLRMSQVVTAARVSKVFPASLLYAIQHYTRMIGMGLVSIDAMLVARQLVPVLCALLEKTLKIEKKPQSRTTLWSMLAIIVGVLIYSHGKHDHLLWPLNLAGIWAITLHVVSSAVANVYAKRACQNMEASEYTLLVNLTSIPIALATIVPIIPYDKALMTQALVSMQSISGLSKLLALFSILFSIAISFAASFTQQSLAAASFAIFSNILKILTIVMDNLLDSNGSILSAVSWLGICLSFGGGFCYSYFRTIKGKIT